MTTAVYHAVRMVVMGERDLSGKKGNTEICSREIQTYALSLITAICTHPVTAFFLLAYLFSWAFWTPVALLFPGPRTRILPLVLVFCGTFGPAVSAVLLSRLVAGKESVRSLWLRIIHWHVRR